MRKVVLPPYFFDSYKCIICGIEWRASEDGRKAFWDHWEKICSKK